MIFQKGFVHLLEFPRGLLKVSRGFVLLKTEIDSCFSATFSQNFTFQSCLPLRYKISSDRVDSPKFSPQFLKTKRISFESSYLCEKNEGPFIKIGY